MYASLIKNDGTFGGGQSVDGFGRIENSGLLWHTLFSDTTFVIRKNS